MKIDHIAIWTNDLEKVRNFYVKYFGCTVSEKYENISNGFSSFFLSFEHGSRLEIMKRDDINAAGTDDKIGFAHISFNIGTKNDVDNLTRKFRNDGFVVASLPRTTGDGYYESVILDPDNNRIELLGI